MHLKSIHDKVAFIWTVKKHITPSLNNFFPVIIFSVETRKQQRPPSVFSSNIDSYEVKPRSLSLNQKLFKISQYSCASDKTWGFATWNDFKINVLQKLTTVCSTDDLFYTYVIYFELQCSYREQRNSLGKKFFTIAGRKKHFP